jgi:hypothetical protein
MIAGKSKIDPCDFSGKRVLVTGGTKGAGKAIVAFDQQMWSAQSLGKTRECLNGRW